MLKELRALALGLHIGLGEALATAANLLRVAGVQQSTGPRRGKGRTNGTPPRWFGKRVRTVSRHKRDPNSPVLAAAIAKGGRRERLRDYNAGRSAASNRAHQDSAGFPVPRLNPLYVNHEV